MRILSRTLFLGPFPAWLFVPRVKAGLSVMTFFRSTIAHELEVRSGYTSSYIRILQICTCDLTSLKIFKIDTFGGEVRCFFLTLWWISQLQIVNWARRFWCSRNDCSPFDWRWFWRWYIGGSCAQTWCFDPKGQLLIWRLFEPIRNSSGWSFTVWRRIIGLPLSCVYIKFTDASLTDGFFTFLLLLVPISKACLTRGEKIIAGPCVNRQRRPNRSAYFFTFFTSRFLFNTSKSDGWRIRHSTKTNDCQLRTVVTLLYS